MEFWGESQLDRPTARAMRSMQQWLNNKLHTEPQAASAPTLTNGVAVTFTTDYDEYYFVGGQVAWNFSCTVTSAGSAGGTVLLRLPIRCKYLMNGAIVGIGTLLDAGVRSNLIAEMNSTGGTNIAFGVQGAAGSARLGNTPSFAFANGDILRVQCLYPYNSTMTNPL